MMIDVIVTTTLLFAFMQFYFFIAKRYNIVDIPNHRTSHLKPTMRGGGIVLPMSLLVAILVFNVPYYFFAIGLFMVSAISFVDDVKSIPFLPRLVVHIVSLFLLIYQIEVGNVLFAIVLSIIATGVLNVYNFMDGINGITALNSLIGFLTLWYVDVYVVDFVANEIIWVSVLSVLVFSFYNVRKKAKCFAGDVGSISIAFVILFLIGKLLFASGNLVYILFMLIFLVDGFITIVYRLRNRENILAPHRTHLYQYLANEVKMPHVLVATIYAIFQLFVNIIVILLTASIKPDLIFQSMLLFAISIMVISIYLFVRAHVVRKFVKPNKQ